MIQVVDFAELLEDADDAGWFLANFTGGECTCGKPIKEGDEIRYDLDDCLERRECCGR